MEYPPLLPLFSPPKPNFSQHAQAEGNGVDSIFTHSGYLLELAQTLKALVVFGEMRFFGESMPFGEEGSMKPTVDRIGKCKRTRTHARTRTRTYTHAHVHVRAHSHTHAHAQTIFFSMRQWCTLYAQETTTPLLPSTRPFSFIIMLLMTSTGSQQQ